MAGGTPANPATLVFARATPQVSVDPEQANQQQEATEHNDLYALHSQMVAVFRALIVKSVDLRV
jgi:hypothetical protein